MSNDLESKIHRFLFRHPYLIDPKFKDIRPLYEMVLDDKRIDLVFLIRKRLTVVEIKKTFLKEAHVDQIVEYCNRYLLNNDILAAKHYLIGKRPLNTETLESYIKETSF